MSAAWPTVELGEIVEFLDHKRRPITANERVEGPYPYYGANGLLDHVADYLFDEPLVLLAEDGGYFDEPERGIAYAVSGKTWVNNHAHVLRPRPNVDIGYLRWSLAHYDVRAYLSGSTRAKLTKGMATRITLPLPPFEEQKRIAAILGKADEIWDKRMHSAALLDQLRSSYFLEMFGRSTDALGSCTGTAESVLFGDIAFIRTGKLDANAASPDGAFPFFTCARETLRIDKPAFDGKAVLLAGNGDLNVKYYEGAFNAYQRTYVIQSKDESCVRTRFLFGFLDVYVEKLREQSIGGVIKYIKLPYLTDARVRLPSIVDQDRFVDLMDSTDALETIMISSDERTNHLIRSLQQRAFAGKL